MVRLRVISTRHRGLVLGAVVSDEFDCECEDCTRSDDAIEAADRLRKQWKGE